MRDMKSEIKGWQLTDVAFNTTPIERVGEVVVLVFVVGELFDEVVAYTAR